MRKRKLAGIGVLLGVTALLFGGCNEKEAPQKLRVGVTYYDQNDTYLNELIGLFKESLKEIESDKLEVSVTIRDAAGVQKNQNDQVEELIDEGCNILCVNLVDRADPSEIIDLARESEVPIIFFNREPVAEDLRQWEKLYYVGADAKQSGKLQGELAVEMIEENPQIDKNKDISVLRDISFEANYGEFVSILGVSGSGKSTLLNCISSLSAPTEGVVKVNNCNPYQLKNSRLSKFRREDISFIFQSYNLLPALPVLENVALPLRLSHKKVCRDDIQTLLDKMNFRADLMSSVSSLSGGEKQKVAIARAILSKTRIIFADEPTGALDSTSRKIIFEMLADLAQEGRCVIMVTHDIELASQTDRALILKDGKIYQELFNPTAEALYKALEIENSGG